MKILRLLIVPATGLLLALTACGNSDASSAAGDTMTDTGTISVAGNHTSESDQVPDPPAIQKTAGKKTAAVDKEPSAPEKAGKKEKTVILDDLDDDPGPQDKKMWFDVNNVFNPGLGKNAGELNGPADKEAAKNIFVMKGDPCGEGDCGNVIYIQNGADDKKIEVLINASWKDLDGNQQSESRIYETTPGESLAIGCNHLCYGEKVKVKITWKVVGARYL